MSARKKRAPKSGAYTLAEPIAPGLLIIDAQKREWILCNPIGQGGFGRIYAAKLNGDKKEKFAVKIEPQENGPLFTEMHFYMRICAEASIRQWIIEHNLKFLGIPRYLTSGVFRPTGQNPCRYLIMDRYSGDFESLLKQGLVKQENVLKSTYHVLNSLEYLHSKDYAHADIKASNLLYSVCYDEVTLVDFGLVHLFRSNGVHHPAKPDPKYRHNGTVEFCPRDSHNGLPPSRRGDLEILLYNLVHWLTRCRHGSSQSSAEGLPWGHLVSGPKLRQSVPDRVKLQVASIKEHAMRNLQELMTQTGLSSNSDLLHFARSIDQLDYDETPNYDQLRHYILAIQRSQKSPVSHKTSPVSSKRSSSELSLSAPLNPPVAEKKLRQIKSKTPGEPVEPHRRPRGRPPASTIRNRQLPTSSAKPVNPTNSMDHGRKPDYSGQTDIDQPFGLSRSPLETGIKSISISKQSPLLIPPARSSPRFKPADSVIKNRCNRVMFSEGDEQTSPTPPKLVESSERKALTPLNPQRGIDYLPSPQEENGADQKTISVRSRRSGFCQTSPELLLLAKAEALGRRAAELASCIASRR